MRRLVALLTMAGVLLGAAGAWQQAEAHPVITIRGSDFAFDGPTTIRAGFVALDFVNVGAEPHHAQIVRLNEGVTPQQFMEALQQGPEAALPLVTLVGGPGVVVPRARQRVELTLQPGQYYLLCFIESPDGTPHVAKGMIRGFRVTGAVAARPAPETDGEIVLTDFRIALPAGFTGRGLYRVINRGAQPHEAIFMRLAPGKTTADAMAFLMQPGAMAGPPPAIPVGGAQGLSRGRVNYLRLNLAPGRYVALCFIPDPGSGKAHVELGMEVEFEIR